MKTVRPDARRAIPVEQQPVPAPPALAPPTTQYDDELPESVKIVPTIYPTSPPLEASLERFWDTGEEFDGVEIAIEPPDRPLGVLEKLGPSPFPRGGFPMVGFLATTYDKVGRYALERK